MNSVILKNKRDESVRRFHPWIFSGAVDRISGAPSEGDVVQVFSHEGELLGSGHWQKGSIAVRMLVFGEGNTDRTFWKDRIEKAFKLRQDLGIAGSEQTTAWRLVHGEGDNLPGLIVDIYGSFAVIQAHSAGMYLAENEISSALQEVFTGRLSAIYDKSSSTVPIGKENINQADKYIFGNSDVPVTVKENGRLFLVDWITGQKTGFFLDQRENRALVEKFSKGRRVLNLFSYTGGFTVYALAGGALSVDSVDSSKIAPDLALKNIEANKAAGVISKDYSHRFHCSDVGLYLKNCDFGDYDLAVVDPPAYAKHRDAIPNALRGYQKLNAAVIEKISPGGLIFTFSCSQAIDRNSFALAVFSAAAQAGRKVRILDRLSQPADHPVNIYHPEGEYLKGLLLYVD